MFQPRMDEERIQEILERDRRFERGAYDFTRQAVSYASEVFYATSTHVTGQELLEAIRDFALNRYGIMTREVFEVWRVRAGEDFGEIVYNLIEAGLLSKTEEDSKEDFQGGGEFEDLFDSQRYWQEVLETTA